MGTWASVQAKGCGDRERGDRGNIVDFLADRGFTVFYRSRHFFFSVAGKKKKRSRVDLDFITLSITFSFRRCTTCRKRRSLRTNSFFAEYPKISMGELLLLIYFWSMDVTREKTARMMSINVNLVCRVFRRLEDVCSLDIDRNPFIPFGGTAVIKCDESKFNHKAKVRKKRNMVKRKLGRIGIRGP